MGEGDGFVSEQFSFWFLFLTSGLAHNFNISRGNWEHSAFSTSDTRGLHSGKCLTRAGRAGVFPCQACAEALQGTGMWELVCCMHQYKRNSRERSCFPSGSRCDSRVARTLCQEGSATQSSWVSPQEPALPSKKQPMEEVKPSALPRLTHQFWGQSVPGNHFLFLPKVWISCTTYLSKLLLKSRSIHWGSTWVPDLLFLTKKKNGSL